MVPQIFVEKSPKAVVQSEPNCPILSIQEAFRCTGPYQTLRLRLGGTLMALFLSVMSVMAPFNNKADVRAALQQGSSKRAARDFVLMVLGGARMERWIIDNQDRKAPRVRHRRLP